MQKALKAQTKMTPAIGVVSFEFKVIYMCLLAFMDMIKLQIMHKGTAHHERTAVLCGPSWEFSYQNAACAILPSQNAAIIFTVQGCSTCVLKCLPAVFGHRPAAFVALSRT